MTKKIYTDIDFNNSALLVNGTGGADKLLGTDPSGNAVLIDTQNGFTVFPIWAEEGAALSNNVRQWSFGNGATGAINIVLPVDADLFAVSFDSIAVTSDTVSLDIMKNDVSSFTTSALSVKDFESLATPLSFSAGDCIGFRTNTITGPINNARACAWFRIRSTEIGPALLNDLLDVSGTPSVNDVIKWNGSGWSPAKIRRLVDASNNDRVFVENTGDVTISNYPETRNDATRVDGKSLYVDSSGTLQYGRNLPFYASNKVTSNSTTVAGVNQTTTLTTHNTLSFTVPEAGNYDIDWRYTWSVNSGQEDFVSQILVDGSPIDAYPDHRQEPKDAAGPGIDLLNTTGGVTNTGTNQRLRLSDFEAAFNFSAGAHTVEIQWAGSINNVEAAIYSSTIRVRRCS